LDRLLEFQAVRAEAECAALRRDVGDRFGHRRHLRRNQRSNRDANVLIDGALGDLELDAAKGQGPGSAGLDDRAEGRAVVLDEGCTFWNVDAWLDMDPSFEERAARERGFDGDLPRASGPVGWLGDAHSEALILREGERLSVGAQGGDGLRHEATDPHLV